MSNLYIYNNEKSKEVSMSPLLGEVRGSSLAYLLDACM